jgi:hypothetical protein
MTANIKHVALALVLTVAAALVLYGQTPVTIVNTQAVDYPFGASLTVGGGSSSTGPVMSGRTSNTEPTNATGDTQSWPVWLFRSGAPAMVQVPTAVAGAATSTTYIVSTASTNCTNVKASAGNVYSLLLENFTSTPYFFRFYDLASAPTASSATGFKGSIGIPHGTGAGGGFVVPMPHPETFTTGIAYCITLNAASTDNNAAVVGLYGRMQWK